MRFLRIRDGVVINAEAWAEAPVQDGFTFIKSDIGGIGDSYDSQGGKFTPPPQEEVRRLIDKSIILDRVTDEQLTRALSIMTQRQKERWRMPSKPEIYVDDPDLLMLLEAIGANKDAVLAP